MTLMLSVAARQVLHCIAVYGPISHADVARSVHTACDIANGRALAESLHLQGYVTAGETPPGKPQHLVVTRKGRNYLAAGMPQAISYLVAQPRIPYSEECYDGRDLRPFNGRAGALDAFRLPSIINGYPVPPKGGAAR